MKLTVAALFLIANLSINSAANATNLSLLPSWSSADSAQVLAAKKNKQVRKGHRAKFDKGSGETTKERDRRLERECKGRPNAGACLGYAN